ncbi:SprT-like domain-containing protein [Georgenia alba]|uniref:SprT-like domain-containing protein n=1 Tax=Georgenia alba TaxID=2233858 RepID=A0ABW2Q9D0_9MICO
MELRAVRVLGEELLAEHGLADWRLRFDNAKRRAGACRFDIKVISVSRHLMALYTEEHVRDTLLHEIAHALVGPEHGHDAVWRAQAHRIGCSGQRLVDADAPRPPAPWRGTCPRGHTYERHRRPSRPASCARCDRGFNTDFLLRWTYRGQSVSPGPVYERELARLLATADHSVLAGSGVDATDASLALADRSAHHGVSSPSARPSLALVDTDASLSGSC